MGKTQTCFTSLLEIIANSDQRHDLDFDCNQEAKLLQGTKPLTDFN